MRVQQSIPFLGMSIVRYGRLIQGMFGMILFIIGLDYPLYGWWNRIGIPASTCQYVPQGEMNIAQMSSKMIKFEQHHPKWCMIDRFLTGNHRVWAAVACVSHVNSKRVQRSKTDLPKMGCPSQRPANSYEPFIHWKWNIIDLGFLLSKTIDFGLNFVWNKIQGFLFFQHETQMQAHGTW